nr:homolog of EHV2 ORF66 protein UL49 [Macronycteris gammaherpesvirus 1]
MAKVSLEKTYHCVSGWGVDITEACSSQVFVVIHDLCAFLHVDYNDVRLFVLYGHSAYTRENCPEWILKLVTCTELIQFVNYIHNQRVNSQDFPSLQESIFCLQQLFLLIVLVIVCSIYLKCKTLLEILKNMLKNLSWPMMLTVPFQSATHMFFSIVKLENVCIPLVQCNDNIFPLFINMKKRPRQIFQNSSTLSVMAPHKRLTSPHKFLTSFNDVDSHERHYIESLQKNASYVPCGNPFNSMVKSLTFESMIGCKYVVLPNNVELKSSMVYDLYTKYIGYCILTPLFSIPVLCSDPITNSKSCEAIVCMECGHCLNFGKGKFKKLSFKPTHAFYCRDQKEKCFTVCASTGRIYCSFCGSSKIQSFPMKFIFQSQQYIRAVSAGNSNIAATKATDEIDVVLPCLGENCTKTILKRLSLFSLIYITSSKANLYCSECL